MKHAHIPGSRHRPAGRDPAFWRDVVNRASGLRVRHPDVPELAGWIEERCRALGLAAQEAYEGLLFADGPAGRLERELLAARLTTGETYFLRDDGQFGLLATRILPELVERRAAERRLRLWSAGCSTGEEAYSLAMLLLEMSPRLDGWDIQVLGTDINTRALARARAGLYREWSFRGIDDHRREAWFRPQGREGWQIDSRLRAMVTFRAADLLKDACPDPAGGTADVDLILCRNVFIYLEPPAVRAIAAKFAAALAEGGYLMTGHAELLGHNTPGLHTRVFAESVVLRKPCAGEVEAVVEAAATPVERVSERSESPGRVSALAPPSRPETRAAKPESAPPVAPQAPAVTPEEQARALLEAGWRDADQGRSAQAEQACHRAAELAPFDPGSYYLMAQLAQERGDDHRARSMLDKVIYLDPAFAPAYLELASLLEREGHRDRARHLLRAARRELRKKSPSECIAPYGTSTVGDMLAYVEHLIDGTAQPARPEAEAPRRAGQGH